MLSSSLDKNLSTALLGATCELLPKTQGGCIVSCSGNSVVPEHWSLGLCLLVAESTAEILLHYFIATRPKIYLESDAARSFDNIYTLSVGICTFWQNLNWGKTTEYFCERVLRFVFGPYATNFQLGHVWSHRLWSDITGSKPHNEHLFLTVGVSFQKWRKETTVRLEKERSLYLICRIHDGWVLWAEGGYIWPKYIYMRYASESAWFSLPPKYGGPIGRTFPKYFEVEKSSSVFLRQPLT